MQISRGFTPNIQSYVLASEGGGMSTIPVIRVKRPTWASPSPHFVHGGEPR